MINTAIVLLKSWALHKVLVTEQFSYCRTQNAKKTQAKRWHFYYRNSRGKVTIYWILCAFPVPVTLCVNNLWLGNFLNENYLFFIIIYFVGWVRHATTLLPYFLKWRVHSVWTYQTQHAHLALVNGVLHLLKSQCLWSWRIWYSSSRCTKKVRSFDLFPISILK